MKKLEKILEEIRVKSIELKNKHWGDDERHLTGKGVEVMCVQAEQIIRKHLSRENVPEITRYSRDNDGWIPVEERLPEDDRYIFLSFENFSLPMIGRYEQDSDGSGNFYIGDETESCISQDLYVTAWQPLLEPYHPERRGEE